MKLSERSDMHARDCVRAADMDTDAVLSKHQIDDMADALREAAELARSVEWQPIETAPRDGTRILAMIRWSWSDGTDGEAQDVIYWHAGAQFWVCGTPMNYVQVLHEGVEPTHWRPLPDPPQDSPTPPDPGHERG